MSLSYQAPLRNMSNSREYYHSSTSRGHGAHERHLPPIRDVVGDELDRRNSYAFNDVRGALPTSAFGQSSRGDQRGPTLPPIQHGGQATSNSRSAAYLAAEDGYSSEYPAATSQRGGHQGSHRRHPSQGQEYAYAVLRTSGGGNSLIHATPPAPRAQGILRQGGAPTQTYSEESDKRHKCEYCGKRFDRPSSLQVHVRTHTGSQPFTCGWPGCERSFSVRSNMLRHWRSHERSEVSHFPSRDGDEEDELDEDYSHGKSSSTSKRQQSSSSYYTFSRHM